MSFKRSTAVTLATVTTMLGAAGPALAMPARDHAASHAPAPAVVAAPVPSTGHGGVSTLAVVLLSAGALVAGAAAGFGGAKASAGRTPLHRH